jgi:DNA topoisomerase-1
LTLPRVVGVDPSDGVEIVAQNGRYGPYLKKGNDSRSLASEDQLFTVTLEEATAIFAQPKARRGQGSTAPLRELGQDPVTARPIVLKEGRFGPYVTDGETNASLRKGDTVDALTPERAAELLADRRASGPPAKKARGSKKAASARTSGSGSRSSGATRTSGSASKVGGVAEKASPAKKTAAKTVKKTAAKSVKKTAGTARKTTTAKKTPVKKRT